MNGIVFHEIFLFNFAENVYGKSVFVKVLKKIRDVRKFKSKENLFKQIKKDVEIGKKLFNLK